MLVRALKHVSRKLAITAFTLLEVFGLPREARRSREDES